MEKINTRKTQKIWKRKVKMDTSRKIGKIPINSSSFFRSSLSLTPAETSATEIRERMICLEWTLIKTKSWFILHTTSFFKDLETVSHGAPSELQVS